MRSPYLTTLEAAIWLRFVTPDAPDYNAVAKARGLRRLNKFLTRYQDVERVKRGRDVLIDRVSLQAHLDRQKGALKSRASRFQQGLRSLHGAGVSIQTGREIHAPESAGSSSPVPLNKVAKELHS